MNKRIIGGIACLALMFGTAAVFAQLVGNAVPNSTIPGDGTTIPLKSPPLKDTDTWSTGWGWHPGGTPGGTSPPAVPGTGWAGEMVTIHVLDSTEVDVTAIRPAPGVLLRIPGAAGTGPVFTTGPVIDPLGPRSSNQQSVPYMFTAWHPLAQQSGLDVPVSQFQHLFDLDLHAKSTFPRNNSDTDVLLSFTEIWHSRPSPESATLHAEFSDHLWVFSTVDWQQFHITSPNYESLHRLPEGPPLDDPGGHWTHVPESLVFHSYGDQGSNFWKRGGRTYAIGIEHVPEPTALALLALGLVCAVKGVRSSVRRRSQT